MHTFCVMPWFNKEISIDGRETACCLLPPAHDLGQIRQDLLAGRQTPACQKCWNLENLGLKSDRQVKNAALDFYLDKDLDKIQQMAIDNTHSIRMLKLETSFICNSTCVSCSAHASSSWNDLNKKHFPNSPTYNYSFIDVEKIKRDIDFKQLRMLSLLGGEPLLEKKNFELLQHLLDIGNHSVFISMITNGSVNITDDQKKLLSRFKNLNFSVSIDGTESVFEYLRFPLKWDDLLKNLHFFRQLTDKVSSNYTLSNLNILYHNTTTQWFDHNNIVYSVNMIYNPAWLQPRALPMSIKQHLKTVLSGSDYASFIGHQHTQLDQINFSSMLQNTNLQDRAKKIHMIDYLPDLVHLINIGQIQ